MKTQPLDAITEANLRGPEGKGDTALARPRGLTILRWAAAIAATLALLAIAASVPLAAWHSYGWSAEAVIRLLGVIISWPTAFLVAVTLVGRRFGHEIREILRARAFKVSVAGAQFEVAEQRQLPAPIEDAPTADLEKTPEIEQPEALEHGELTPSEQSDELARHYAEIAALQQTARHWKFLHLDTFLALHTKRVLAWLAQHPSVSRDYYNTIWRPLIESDVERTTVLQALAAKGLIAGSDIALYVTPEGKEYLSSRGLDKLPPPVTGLAAALERATVKTEPAPVGSLLAAALGGTHPPSPELARKVGESLRKLSPLGKAPPVGPSNSDDKTDDRTSS